MIKGFVYTLLLCLLVETTFSQKTVNINRKDQEHIFIKTEIECLEDSSNKLTINEIQNNASKHHFHANSGFYPRNHHSNSSYWFRIKINFTEPLINKFSVFEFFDQTTGLISAYTPDSNGHYHESIAGAYINFENRLYKHKNFEFLLNNQSKGEHYYYFKVRSHNLVNIIIVYRTVDHFIHYALTEYLTYGIFYGMILIFCLHNLLMFLAIKKRHYLFYVLYILSVGLYEMCTDGIAFQYVWPNSPGWNEYAYGTALYSVSLFALLFTRSLLHVKFKAYNFYRLINYVIVLRTLYFIFCLTVNHKFFNYKFVEFIPLFIAFITGIRIWKKGFKPARFFVLGYAVLFAGFIIKAVTVLGIVKLGLLGFYSLSFSFILEMAFLSIAIGDQVRLLNWEKDTAKDETIRQMDLNNKLKDSINQELEEKVTDRTREVVEKSSILMVQAEIIKTQNQELIKINNQLKGQAAEISMMNVLLEKDNIELKHNIEEVTDARVHSKELSFEEFSAKYPDKESCNKFLSELKWSNDYSCIKCLNTAFNYGRSPYSRRCTKCGYEESVLFNTIFQNSRIPINKAFYLVYLIYSTKGAISSYQLSEKIGIRQSTCWQYSIRIKKAIIEQKRYKSKNENQGWSKLILENPQLSQSNKLAVSQ